MPDVRCAHHGRTGVEPLPEASSLTAPTSAVPSPRAAGGRILVAWSAADGAVPASEHIEASASACREGFGDFDPARDVLAHASARAVAGALARAADAGEPCAVLHLLCHGGAAGSTFGLTLDDGEGGAQVVDAGRMRQLLAPHAATLRLGVPSPGRELEAVPVAAIPGTRYPAQVRCHT